MLGPPCCRKFSTCFFRELGLSWKQVPVQNTWENGDATFLAGRGVGSVVVLDRATGGRPERRNHYRSHGPALRPDPRWVTQAQVNRGFGRLQTLGLADGVLYAQSNRATLEAIDAETGQKFWSKMVGRPDQPSLLPGACRDLVATINGCTLYVLNRYTGDILYQTEINGAPGGGPGLSSKRAYVPMIDGLVLAYRLEPITDAAKELGKIDPHAAAMSEDEKKEAAKKAEEERRENIRIRQDYIPPLVCSSTGRAMVPPLVTSQNRDEEFVTWVSDRGYLFIGYIDRRSEDSFYIKHRLGTKGIFNNPPAYCRPTGR